MESTNFFYHPVSKKINPLLNASKNLALITLLCASQLANATPINIQTIALTDQFNPGTHFTWGAGVNNSGQVVYAATQNYQSFSIMYSDPQQLFFTSSQYATSISNATPAISNSGHIAYEGNGIWIDQQHVIKPGDAVPTTPNNLAGTQTFSNIIGLYNRNLSDAGETAFGATTSLGENGIWRTDAIGTLTMVAIEGETAPDSGGAQFAQIASSGAMNSSGDLVFAATLNDANATKGIWRQTAAGIFERVAIDDMAIIDPNTNQLMHIGNSITEISNLAIDGNGNPIFQATITNMPGQFLPFTAVWRMNGSTAEHIPDANGWNLTVNAAGQIAFMGGGFSSGQYNTEVWASDLSGDLNLIAMGGQLLEVLVGDLRTVINVAFAPPGLSDNGKVAFSAAFDDGSEGIFLATFDYTQHLVTSPGTLFLMLAGLAGISFTRTHTQKVA